MLAKLTMATDSRRLGVHGLRFWNGGDTLPRCLLFPIDLLDVGASGLKLFQAQLQITVFFLSITSIFGFSQVITEEKEEDTLGLMRPRRHQSAGGHSRGKVTGTFCEAVDC